MDETVLKIRVSGKRHDKQKPTSNFKKLVKKEWNARKRILENKPNEHTKPNIDTALIRQKNIHYDKKVTQAVAKTKAHANKTYAATSLEPQLLLMCNEMRANTLTFLDKLIHFATQSLAQFTRNTQTIQHMVKDGNTEENLGAVNTLVDRELVSLTKMEHEFLTNKKFYLAEIKRKNKAVDTILGQLSQTDSVYANLAHAIWALELRRARWASAIEWPE